MDAPKCYVAGKVVKASVRRMSFGQHWRSEGVTGVDYRVD
jgi:hypothetical protein